MPDMTDQLLGLVFQGARWETAISSGVAKGIHGQTLKRLCDPAYRQKIKNQIQEYSYHIQPPHEAQIPKDDGSMRTVYANSGTDRVLLSIINDLFFELCPDMVHPACTSYQKGNGCGKTVKHISGQLAEISDSTGRHQAIGVKADLSKYFDSVPRQQIHEIFDQIKAHTGSSAILDLIYEYYDDDTIITLNKQKIQKYTSLKQGCAVAAFLADAALYDIDQTVSKLCRTYARYSDDILILGDGWEQAYSVLSDMLKAKNLALNPKKVEYLKSGEWFTFLGFALNNSQITLSPKRVKTFQKEILARTINADTRDLTRLTKDVHTWLYGCAEQSYSWASGALPVMNDRKGLQVLNGFAMDAVRAAALGRHKIGGIGFSYDKSQNPITRGPGRHTASNKKRIPILDGWRAPNLMKNGMSASREVYRLLANQT